MPRAKSNPEDLVLTEMQERFVEEYMLCFKGAPAAVKAGFSEVTAKEQASQMLRMPHIKNELQRRFAERREEFKARAMAIENKIYELACETPGIAPRDQIRALELAGKFYGMLSDKVEHTHFNGGDAKIEAEATAKEAVEVYSTLLN